MPLIGGRNVCWASRFCFGFVLLIALAPVARAVTPTTPTTTTLSIAPSTSVPVGTALTFRAAVTAGVTPVTLGTVTLYDGSTALASAQLVGSGLTYTHGAAYFKLHLGAGAHAIKAAYRGTSLDGPSTSSTSTVTLTAPLSAPTTTVISATGAPGNYTLTGTVTTMGSVAPTGSVSFIDQTNSNFLLGSAALSVASQTIGWNTLTPHVTGAATYGVLAVDLNGDGFPDLVSTNYGGSTMSVQIGNGDGTFQPHVDYPVGTFSFGLAAGDLNGDGIPDLVVASGTTNTVQVFLGNGNGTFQTGQAYSTGGVAAYVVLADFNNDGILDLATCAGGTGTTSVLLGNGDGTFGTQQTFGVTVFPDSLAAGDFDGDGNMDLVVSNNTVNSVSVFLGKGDGTFQAPVDYTTGNSPTNIAVVDLNGDGKQDLVVCDSVGFFISVLLGNGDGTFQPKVDYSGRNDPWGIVVADVNGDSFPDVVVTSPGTQFVEVFEGKGDGTLLPPISTHTGVSNYLLALGDLNGDGVLDLAVPDISAAAVYTSLGSISSSATLAGVSVPGGGSHNVVASYAGDANSAPSVSPPISLMGTPFSTTVALSASPASGPSGQTFTFTASISPASSSGYSAGGTVTFFDGGVSLGAPATVLSGVAVLSTNSLAAGTHSITATYSGDANFNGSTTASPVLVTVTAQQTITFPQPAPVTYGIAPFMLNATASSGLPVSFSVVSGPATVAGATLTVRGAGNVVIQADQAGNVTTPPAAPVQRILVVNRAASALALTASAFTVPFGGSVTFTATVSSANLPAPTGTITFFDGAVQLAPTPLNGAGIATYATSALAIGTHSITATYPGDANFLASTSPAVVITIQAFQTINFPAFTPVTYGVPPLTLTATASSGLPVTFSLVSGPASLAGNVLTILGAGSVVVRADQAGDATYPPAMPVARVLMVNRAQAQVILTTTAATIPVGNSVTFTATLLTGLPTAPLQAPTGTVTFYDYLVPLATVPVNSAGFATYSSNLLAVGTHDIVVTYSGDRNFLNSSTGLLETVQGPGYSVTANPASLTVKLGQTATSTITITPVGNFQGQVTITCGGGAPQISACSLNPATVALPGDNLPHTVQFMITTDIIKGALDSPGGVPGNQTAAWAVLFPFGLAALVSITGRRKTNGTTRRSALLRRCLGCVLLAAVFCDLPGCGGGRSQAYGTYTVVTSAQAPGGVAQNIDISLPITP